MIVRTRGRAKSKNTIGGLNKSKSNKKPNKETQNDNKNKRKGESNISQTEFKKLKPNPRQNMAQPLEPIRIRTRGQINRLKAE